MLTEPFIRVYEPGSARGTWVCVSLVRDEAAEGAGGIAVEAFKGETGGRDGADGALEADGGGGAGGAGRLQLALAAFGPRNVGFVVGNDDGGGGGGVDTGDGRENALRAACFATGIAAPFAGGIGGAGGVACGKGGLGAA